MTILDQVQAELVTAAGRPPLRTRISIRAVAVLIAAFLALLIAAPPTVAHLAVYAGVATTHVMQ